LVKKQRGEIMSNQIEGFIKGIIVGGAIGAVIGILYAPQAAERHGRILIEKRRICLRRPKRNTRQR
jgi:hypothetical protein